MVRQKNENWKNGDNRKNVSLVAVNGTTKKEWELKHGAKECGAKTSWNEKKHY